MKRHSIVRLYLLFLFILGVWPVMAQDGDPLPLPVIPGQSQLHIESPVTYTSLGGLLNPSGVVSTDPVPFADFHTNSRVFTQIQPISPPATAGDQQFGIDLARDGDVMVVGAPIRTAKGAAIVYTQNTSGAWGSPVILTASDGAADDGFGINVAMMGDMIMVGAPYTNEKGAVYVFKRDAGGNWVQMQKLQPAIPNGSDFGAMIKLDPAGNQMLVGANEEGIGAFLYRLDAGLWQFENKLEAAGTTIGLSIQGNRALVGSLAYTGMGAVMVYEKAAGAWTQTGTFAASDLSVGDRFGGRIVEVDDQVLVLGDLNNAGAVYVFREVGGVLTQQQKLTPSDGAANDGFGIAYSVQGDTMVIGSPLDEGGLGSVYIFKWTGSAWVQENKIPAVGGNFGIDLILHEGELLVGAPNSDDAVGKVYAYSDPDLMPATELLTDGGFESDATGWEIKNPTADNVKCNKLGKTFSHEGECAWRFKGGTGENAIIGQMITTGLHTGDTLTLSGYVNASGAVDSKIKIVVKYADPSVEKTKITVNVNAATGGLYTPLSSFQPILTTSMTASVDRIKVMVRNSGTNGKVYYDVLSLIAQ